MIDNSIFVKVFMHFKITGIFYFSKTNCDFSIKLPHINIYVYSIYIQNKSNLKYMEPNYVCDFDCK